MNQEQKIFEDYPTVDCNTCESYWTDQCDGVTHEPKECKFYKATRAVVIPAQIDYLHKRIDNTRLLMSIGFGLTAGGFFTILMRMM